MRIIISILIGMVFTLFGLIKLQGGYDMSTVNLINMDGTFEIDISFIKTFSDFILYIPELIINGKKENIRDFFQNYAILGDLEVYLFVIFIYHLLLSYIIGFISSIFLGNKIKLYFKIGLIGSYILFIFILKSLSTT